MNKKKVINLIFLIIFLIGLILLNNNIEKNINNENKVSEKKYELKEKKHIITKDTVKIIDKNIYTLKVNKYKKEILSNFNFKTNKKIINYYDIFRIKDKINKEYLKNIIILKFDDKLFSLINDNKHFLILDKIDNNLYLYSFDNNYKIINGCEIKMYKGKKSLKKIYKKDLFFLKNEADKLKLKAYYINLICKKGKGKRK